MIPLSVPNLSGNEWNYIKECLDTNWVSSVGSYVDRFENALTEFTQVKSAIATSNGTAAIHISLLLAGVRKDELVIIPNITFVAPCNAITYVGAEPVLIDVDLETWQLDIPLTTRFLHDECTLIDKVCIHIKSGKRIAAILPVHVLGNMVDMNSLLALASRFNIPIIEDATESLGSTYYTKPAGSFGLFGCLSFNGNKIMTTGGGGMLLTNDNSLGKKAKHLTTQAKAHPVEYFHDEIGYNYRLVNVLAAMGLAQFEQLPGFIARKRWIASYYKAQLSAIPGFDGQKQTEGVVSNDWLFTAKFKEPLKLNEFLNSKGIQTRRFWVPMNELPSFGNCLYYQDHDNSKSIYADCLSLPCSTSITDSELGSVVKHIKEFYLGNSILA